MLTITEITAELAQLKMFVLELVSTQELKFCDQEYPILAKDPALIKLVLSTKKWSKLCSTK